MIRRHTWTSILLVLAGGCGLQLQAQVSASPTSIHYYGGGGLYQSLTITAASGVSWSAVSGDTSWLLVVGSASGSGNGTIKWWVKQNPTSTARSTNITITPSTGSVVTVPVSEDGFISGTTPTVAVQGTLSSSVASQIVSVKFTDLNGPGYLGAMTIGLATTSGFDGSCEFYYDPGATQLYMSISNAWVPIPTLQAGTATGTTCQIDTGLSSVQFDGTTGVTLNLALSIRPVGIGTLHLFARTYDATSTYSANSSSPIPGQDWAYHPEVAQAPMGTIGATTTEHSQTLNITLTDPNGYLYMTSYGSQIDVTLTNINPHANNCNLQIHGQQVSLAGNVQGTWTSIGTGTFGSGGVMTVPGSCSVDLNASSLVPTNTADPNAIGAGYPGSFTDMQLTLKVTLDPSIVENQIVTLVPRDVVGRNSNSVQSVWVLPGSSQVSPGAVHYYGGTSQYTTVAVTADPSVRWTVSGSNSWLTLTNYSGTGSGSFRVIALQNNTGAPRSATLTVTPSSGPVLTVTVTQEAFVTGSTPTVTVLSTMSPSATSQVVSIKFDDPNGPNYLQIYAGFGNYSGFDGNCSFSLDTAYGQLYMNLPTGAVLVPIPSPATVSGNVCKIDSAASSIVYDGSGVVLNLALTLQPAAVGTFHLWARTIDGAGVYSANSSSPIPGQDWTVQAEQPVAPTVTISNNNQQTQTVGVTITDPNGYLYVLSSGTQMGLELKSASGTTCRVGTNPVTGYVAFYGWSSGSFVQRGGGYLGSGGVLTSDYCSVDLTNSSRGPIPNPPGGDPNADGTNYPSLYNKVVWNFKWIIDPSVTAPQYFLATAVDVMGRATQVSTSSFVPAPPNPAPVVVSLSPLSATVGSGSLPVTVNGSNFIPSSQVQRNGTDRATTYVSPIQLSVVLTAADLASASTANVTVVNPAPGGGTSNAATFTVNNLTPFIASLTPSMVAAASGGFTLTVGGGSFVPGSKVTWGGIERTTGFVSPTQLTAAIAAADVASPGTAVVAVVNPTPGGGASGNATFTIGSPMPAVVSTTPSSVVMGSGALSLMVTGNGFMSTSQVLWNGQNRNTVFDSPTQLHAAILATDLLAGGTVTISVFNPSPGGGTSSGFSFIVNNPVPVAISTTPVSANAGSPDFSLAVTGSGFVSSSQVRWNGSNRATTYISPTQLAAYISTSDISSSGTATVSVFNPTPGGGTSGNVSFAINPYDPAPAISSLSPAYEHAGGPAFTLTVAGTGFITGSVVQWNGSNRTTTVVSPTQLTVAITAADIASTGDPTVVVVNPAPGGGSSVAIPFPVLTAFNFVQAITIDHTKTGGSDFHDFPFLLSGTYSFLKTTGNGGNVINSNGFDIVFGKEPTCSVSQRLAWETESYDPNGSVAIWINIPTMSAAAPDTVIYMCYGNAAITGNQSTGIVWDQASYGVVYHMTLVPFGGGSGTVLDSTGRGNSAGFTGFAGRAAGRIAQAGSFSGINEDLGAGGSQNGPFDFSTGPMSLSMWFNTSSTIASPTALIRRGACGSSGYAIILQSGVPQFYIQNGGNALGVGGTIPGGFNDGQWHYAVAVRDPGNLYLYIDGVQVGSTTPESVGSISSGEQMRAATLACGGTDTFHGLLDEIRLEHVARDAAWIAAQYANQFQAPFYTISGSADPVIYGLSASAGAIGSTVTITGVNFGPPTSTSTVQFNGTTASVNSWSDSTIQAIVPSGATTGNVQVIVNSVPSNGLPYAITPGITSISPQSAAVGTALVPLNVTGTSFTPTSTVLWNNSPRTTAYNSPTSLTATFNAGDLTTAGLFLVTVSDSGGQSTGVTFIVGASPTSPSKEYIRLGSRVIAIESPPIITGLPQSGAVGGAVRITGMGFGSAEGASRVTFNGVLASVAHWSSTTIDVTVPAGATTGNVVVTVNGTASNGVHFTVTP